MAALYPKRPAGPRPGHDPLNESTAAIGTTRRVAFATSLNAQLPQPSIDVAAKYGLIKVAFPINAMIAGVAG